jgi:hypothetical protein
LCGWVGGGGWWWWVVVESEFSDRFGYSLRLALAHPNKNNVVDIAVAEVGAEAKADQYKASFVKCDILVNKSVLFTN